MNKKHLVIILLIVFLCSCKHSTKKSDDHPSPNNNSAIEQIEDELDPSSQIDKDQIIEKLQGKWKESEYPFRSAEFKNQSVKFIEEGMVEEPRFKTFEISSKCPFEVNNIKYVDTNTTILSINEDKRCEKLKTEDETLILSGYSTNTEMEYEIVYKKMK